MDVPLSSLSKQAESSESVNVVDVMSLPLDSSLLKYTLLYGVLPGDPTKETEIIIRAYSTLTFPLLTN